MTGAAGRVLGEPVPDAADEGPSADTGAVASPADDGPSADEGAAAVPADEAEMAAPESDGAQDPVSAPRTPALTSPRHTRRARRAEAAEPVAGPATAATSDPAAAPASAATSGRPPALRLAGLHLRMGQLPLARAQLEALAGRGDLDDAALRDLAEVRWRTGDMAGAGEAARVLLASGREDGLALLIAAESIAAIGRPGEARRLAARALAVTAGPLDPIFAGMPRNPIWPEDRKPAGDDGAAPADGTGAGHSEHLAHGSRQRHAAPVDGEAGPASAAAAETFAGGRAALAGGDVGLAALRLGVAMRLDAGFATGVLEAVGAWERDPALALVAGDALRLLGREAEALVAFDLARGRP